MDFNSITTPQNSITTLQKHNQHLLKPNNRRLTLDQVRLLETSFKSNPKLQAEHKLELASKLGMSPRQVAIWFQNRRARQKTEAIELDYRTIQLQLDNVLVEKRRLETEVGVLKHQLYKAQQILLASSSHSPADSIPSVSVSGKEEHASSRSIKTNNSYGPESAQGLQVEDLYSCLSYWP